MIDINKIKTVKSDDNPLSFKFVNKTSNILNYILLINKINKKLEVDDREFFFEAQSFDEKEEWIGSIAKVMVHGSKKNIFIEDS